MNLETNLLPTSQRDQGHPSLYGSSPSLTRCLMAHKEVLWSQLIPTGGDSRRNTKFLPYGYTLQPLRNKLDHDMLRQANSILILKHLWLMMELQHASPMTRMTLLGLPRQSQEKLMESMDVVKQHREELSAG